jgi:hypothetical protein
MRRPRRAAYGRRAMTSSVITISHHLDLSGVSVSPRLINALLTIFMVAFVVLQIADEYVDAITIDGPVEIGLWVAFVAAFIAILMRDRHRKREGTTANER